MSKHLISVLLDSLFLGFWAIINFGVEYGLEHLRLSYIETVILRIIQILFGIYTVTPICIFIYRDLRIMLIKTGQRIEEERQGKLR